MAALHFLKVVFAIVSVTPHKKLSEAVLGDAILKFYEIENLIPTGVQRVALEPWCAKMAFASRKLVQRFRPLFFETPHNAKNDMLKKLKARLVDAGVVPDRDEKPNLKREASAEDVEAIQPKGFDWGALAAVVAKHKATEATGKQVAGANEGKAQEALRALRALRGNADSKAESENNGQMRPVATPCRPSHVAPPFVLQSLKDLQKKKHLSSHLPRLKQVKKMVRLKKVKTDQSLKRNQRANQRPRPKNSQRRLESSESLLGLKKKRLLRWRMSLLQSLHCLTVDLVRPLCSALIPPRCSRQPRQNSSTPSALKRRLATGRLAHNGCFLRKGHPF